MPKPSIAQLQEQVERLERSNSSLFNENYKLKQEKDSRLNLNSERNNQTVECLREENMFLKHIVRVYAKDETLKTEIKGIL